MALNWTSSRIGSVLPLIAIGLALANWNARPAAAWAWAAVIAISVVMVAAPRLSHLAVSRLPGDATSARGVASVDRRRRVRRADDDHSAGAVTRARVWPRGRPRQRDATHEHDPGRRVPGRDRQRHSQDAPADIVNAVRRRPSTGVSAASWLDVGALRSWIGDGGAGAANRRAYAHIVGTGSDRHDRDDRAAPAPSQAARQHAPGLNKQHNIVNDDDLRAAECAGSVIDAKSATNAHVKCCSILGGHTDTRSNWPTS